MSVKENSNVWKKCTSIKLSRSDNFDGQSYTDTNGKEWILFLASGDRDSKWSTITMYDVSEDKIVHIKMENIIETLVMSIQSFAIDNKNNILYVCVSRADHSKGNHWILRVDIKNLISKDIQLIDKTIVNQNEYPNFDGHCKMLIIGDEVHFVCTNNLTKHYIFDIKLKQFTLIDQNIHSNAFNHITKSKILKYIRQDCKTGDLIDIKDLYGKFYLTKILTIERTSTVNSKGNNGNDKAKYGNISQIRMTVHYIGFSSKYDETLTIDIIKAEEDETNIICDCNKYCPFNDGRAQNIYHRIALPNSQSLASKSLGYACVMYSKMYKKMLIVGKTLNCWGGIYCKEINDEHHEYRYNNNSEYHNCDHNGMVNLNKLNNFNVIKEKEYFELISYGYIRQYDNCTSNSNSNCHSNLIPMELYALISKYYYTQSDKEWQWIDNGSMFESYNVWTTVFTRCLLVKNGNYGIFFKLYCGAALDGLGNVNENIYKFDLAKNDLINMENIQCPIDPMLGAFYCKENQTVHVFDHRGLHYSTNVSNFFVDKQQV